MDMFKYEKEINLEVVSQLNVSSIKKYILKIPIMLNERWLNIYLINTYIYAIQWPVKAALSIKKRLNEFIGNTKRNNLQGIVTGRIRIHRNIILRKPSDL